jgi:hypothetical protein
LEHINRAIDLKSNEFNLYRIRGYILLEMSDEEGACLDWMVAAEKGFPDVKEMVDTHCRRYFLKGKNY